MTDRFESIDSALPAMAGKIMLDGVEVGSRLGERTMELLHQQIVLERPWRREVLVPGRRANIVAQIAETMWVLAGRNDVEFLGHYLPRAKDFSDDGVTWRGGYGPRLRRWTDFSTSSQEEVDQIKHIVDLLRGDPLTRRAVVSIYDPARDTLPGKDIPCNDFLSFISRNGRLDLSVFVRSNDLVWGWSGINAFEWSALQEIVAGLLGAEVGSLVFNTTSLHIYDRHWQKADRMHVDYQAEVLQDSPRFSAKVVHNYGPADWHPIDRLGALIQRWFPLEERLRTGAGVSPETIAAFPEPMMRSWLSVLAWYWTGNEEYLTPLHGTRLWAATRQVPKSIAEHVQERKAPTALVIGRPSGPNGEYQVGDKINVYPVDAPPLTFIDYLDSLHREKSAAYGDSWKRRGEQMSILANIARKVDRLSGGVETADETQTDTAIDLLIYLAKYRLWLSETNPGLSLPMLNVGDENDNVRALLEWLSADTVKINTPEAMEFCIALIHARFDELQAEVTADPHRKYDAKRVTLVQSLLTNAHVVARARWDAQASHG